MLQNKLTKYILLVLLVGVLVAVRAFENVLFYDPFIEYFKTEFFNLPYPQFNSEKLLVNLVLRYLINSVVTLGVVYILFSDVSKVKFVAMLLLVFLIILLILNFMLLHFFDDCFKMTLFYVRRFILQPIFLLLFIPAFYYQNKTSKINH